MIMNEEFRSLWKEVAVAYFKKLFDIWLERLKESKKGPTDNTDQLCTLILSVLPFS
jgi:hypothetical protein